jgi:hypothetical protein
VLRDPGAASTLWPALMMSAGGGRLGGPVALKAVAPGLLHKTEAGAVRLGLSATDVTTAAREMDAIFARPGWCPVVCCAADGDAGRGDDCRRRP